MNINVGINGFGRIGRTCARAALKLHPNIRILAINDRADARTLAHLLQYDSTRGTYEASFSTDETSLYVDDQRIQVFQKDVHAVPWGHLGVDLVIEATGLYAHREGAQAHLDAGAKKVMLSSPCQDADFTCIMGVNEHHYSAQEHHILSNASCTSNCLGILLKVLDQEFGIEQGCMSTVHPYTSSQVLLDRPHHDLRRGRAASLSIIPTTTEAIEVIHLIMPHLKGKIDGLAIRVPTHCVSLLDLTVRLTRDTSVAKLNQSMQEASRGELRGLLEYSEEELVSCDFRNNSHSAVFDSLSTIRVGGMFKIIAWHDNEWAYACRLLEFIQHIMHKK